MNLVKALKKNSFFLVGAISLFIVGINIVGAQQISPLYIGFINGKRNNLIIFLRKTLILPQSQRWLRIAEEKYGQQEIEKAVFATREEQQARIKKLEQILKKNPNARDALYALSITYKQLGNDKLSTYYLNKAKRVDPKVENQPLIKFTN